MIYDNNNGDILLPLWKRCKHLDIYIYIQNDDEDHSNDQQSNLYIWKEEANELKIWNYRDSWHKNGNFKSASENQKKFF